MTVETQWVLNYTARGCFLSHLTCGKLVSKHACAYKGGRGILRQAGTKGKWAGLFGASAPLLNALTLQWVSTLASEVFHAAYSSQHRTILLLH